MVQLYHQLGGYGSTLHVNNGGTWKYEVVAEDVFKGMTSRGGVLEMVLGIKPNGASYLLFPVLARSDCKWLTRHGRSQPHRADQFESLSPIVFRSAQELASKLDLLAPRKAGTTRVTHDTSKANKVYADARDGPFRAMFEHSRVLYRVLEHNLDPTRLALRPSQRSQLKGLKIMSLALTFWMHQDTAMDVGFCKCSPGTTSALDSCHLRLQMNERLAQAFRTDFTFGTSEVVNEETLYDILEKLLQESGLVLLLVWDQGKTMKYLKRCGIDTSKWKSGLKDFFDYRNPDIAIPSNQIYILDLRLLCEQVFLTSQATTTISKAAGLLEVQVSSTNTQYICAGNDSHYILQMWCALAQEQAIDEQKEWRKNRMVAALAAPPPPPPPPISAAQGEDDDDSDVDPMDEKEPAATTGVASKTAEGGGGGYLSDLDESDYDDEY